MQSLELESPLVRAFLEHAPVGIAILDPDGRHLAVNAEWCRQTGLAPATVVGKTTSEIWGSPESAQAEREQLERIRTARPLTWQAYTHEQDGKPAHYRWGLTAIVDDRGVVTGAVAFTLQVTDQANTERALAALQRAEQDRDLFLAALGHDLRGPLGVIGTGGEILLRSSAALPPEVLRIGARIARNVSRMSRLISQLLEFARSRSGTMTLHRSSFDLRDVCESVVSDAVFADAVTAIELVPGGACPGYWDRDRIEQAVHNLVANAVQHGAAPIRVTLRTERAEAVLEVANGNRGAPITPETLTRVFEPFQRASSQDGRVGLGLGLYISRSVAEAHGGALVAESNADVTRFTLRLPRQ